MGKALIFGAREHGFKPRLRNICLGHLSRLFLRQGRRVAWHKKTIFTFSILKFVGISLTLQGELTQKPAMRMLLQRTCRQQRVILARQLLEH